MQPTKLVIVQPYGSRAEAELAKGELESAGFQAMIQSDTVGGMRDHLAWSADGFKVLVREEDANEARAVLHPPADSDSTSDPTFLSDDDSKPSWRRFT